MVALIRIRPSQADDLATVCAIGAADLQKVAAGIQAAPLTIKRERIRELVGAVVGDETSAALCTVIFGLSALGSRSSEKLPDVVDGLGLTLKAEYPDDVRFASWPEVSPTLLSILLSQSVYLAAKAIDVSYDFERVMTACRIVTSIRPIYTEERETIIGSTIVQTLRIEYVTDEGNQRSTSVALDLSDIDDLIKACTDAKKKAAAARVDLEAGWHRDVVTPGEGLTR